MIHFVEISQFLKYFKLFESCNFLIISSFWNLSISLSYLRYENNVR